MELELVSSENWRAQLKCYRRVSGNRERESCLRVDYLLLTNKWNTQQWNLITWLNQDPSYSHDQYWLFACEDVKTSTKAFTHLSAIKAGWIYGRSWQLSIPIVLVFVCTCYKQINQSWHDEANPPRCCYFCVLFWLILELCLHPSLSPNSTDLYFWSLFVKIQISKLQELLMLSGVTINCQGTKIVMNPGYQLSVL